jgi:hypothetical protein
MATTEGPRHILRYVNPAFCTLHNKEASEMVGQPLSNVMPSAAAESVVALLDRVYAGEKSGVVNNVQHSQSAHRLSHDLYIAWGLPVVDGRTESLMIYVNDLTDSVHRDEATGQTLDEIVSINNEMHQIIEQLIVSGLQLETLANRSRAIAEALQYSILWQVPEKMFRNLNVAVMYESAQDDALVGGDLFDVVVLPNQSIMLIVGDVTGKGLKAVARTAEVIFALRAFAQAYQSPEDMVVRLNELVCDYHRDGNDVDNALIVLLLIVVDPTNGVAHVV